MGTVCIVDDDPDIREVLRLVLEMRGYDVIEAADGVAALSALHGAGCCTILLDLMMPGMSGWEFRARQRVDPELASIPVVVLSGVRDLHRQAGDLGAAAYLQKPVELERLIGEVARFC